MLNWFWSEKFWLPKNTTWSDVANRVGKNVVYAELQDLWSVLPLATGIVIHRYIFVKYCFSSLGRWLNISDSRRKPVFNAVLEAAYRKSSTFKDSVSLAKQLDLTERQVERWWRLRRCQVKPSTLVKFSESLWKGTYYLCSVGFGLNVLWDKEWLWDLEKTYTGYPHQGISDDIWWYYMICTSFYTSLAITQFLDVRRKDFWQMFVHHLTAIVLMSSTWIANMHRISTLILILHDSSDVVLELSKAARCAGFREARFGYVAFTVLWVVTRLVWFPFFILPFTFANMSLSPLSVILCVLLSIMMLLHLRWSWLIFRVAYKTAVYGNEPTSSSEES